MNLSTGLIIGLHTLSLHSSPGFNGTNPGLYLRTPEGLTLGTYYNSERRWSTYAGVTFPVWGPFDLTLGGITGYQRAPIQPLLVPSAHFPLSDGWSVRFAFIPKVEKRGTATFHAMIERRF